MIPVNLITFRNRIHFWFWFAISSTQEPSVISPTFHHNCKICQLICSLVNIKSLNVIFYDFKSSFSLIISGTFIDIHQHIKHSNQDMTTSHTWINAGNVGRFQIFICATNFCQFYINRFFLFCFRKIVFPSKFLSSCFFIRSRIYCTQMFNPDSSHRVLHHISNNPVWCKELGCCWDSLFGNLYILFQFCKGIVL